MYTVRLKNNKSFNCSSNSTIFEAAKINNINLEHSCLSARCRSCIVKLISGRTINKADESVLTASEKQQNYTLSCNSIPISDLQIDVEDLEGITIFEKKIIPAKINSIDFLKKNIIKLKLILPPNSNFKYNAGQYINLIKGDIVRSYSIADYPNENNEIELFIKKYQRGMMSEFLFANAKINDLLRIEGPLGSFFLRDSKKNNLVFLATGTGVAPIRSILKYMEINHKQYDNKSILVIIGARYKKDLFWKPNITNLNIKCIETLSREDSNWNNEIGYVQEILIKQKINLNDCQVYACGSNEMINSARKLLIKNNLNESDFFSDAFVQTN